MSFKAARVSRSSSIVLDGPIEKVFPLFGPVREKEWAEGWNPQIIYSVSSEVEEHMIFQTYGAYGGEETYTWAITQFNPGQYRIEYTVSTAKRIWFIRVECEGYDTKTLATITYTYTGLSAEGNELNKEAIEKMYARDLKDWEEALNYYLNHGKLLTRNH